MSLISRDRKSLANSLSDFDNIFDGFFNPVRSLSDLKAGVNMPRVDVTEKEDSYVIKADLPGVKKEDIDVQVHNSVLTLKASTSSESSDESGNMLRRERHFGQYLRQFTLGQDVDEHSTKAEYKDGVLTLLIQKKTPQKPEARKVTIS